MIWTLSKLKLIISNSSKLNLRQEEAQVQWRTIMSDSSRTSTLQIKRNSYRNSTPFLKRRTWWKRNSTSKLEPRKNNSRTDCSNMIPTKPKMSCSKVPNTMNSSGLKNNSLSSSKSKLSGIRTKTTDNFAS